MRQPAQQRHGCGAAPPVQPRQPAAHLRHDLGQQAVVAQDEPFEHGHGHGTASQYCGPSSRNLPPWYIVVTSSLSGNSDVSGNRWANFDELSFGL